MTFKIKNKKIIFTVFGLFLVTVSVLWYFLLKDKSDYSLDYSIDPQYKEIFSSCLHSEKELEGDDISCIGFLEEANDLSNQDWFLISFLTSDFELNNYSLYENNGFVKWDENLFADPEKTYPIYFDFIFTKGNSSKRELESIEISLVKGEELNDIITIINENQLSIRGLSNKEIELMKEKGYDIGEDMEISDGKYLKTVNLLSVNIYNLSYDNGKFILDSKVYLSGNEYHTQFKIDTIILSPSSEVDDIIVEKASDLENYAEDILGNVLVFSVFGKVNSKLSKSEITEYCTKVNEYVAGRLLCNHLNNIETGSISDDDIDEYVNSETFLESDGFIDLSELLPIYFVENDDVEQGL